MSVILAQRMKIKASEVIAKLMGLGVMATINQPVDTETAMLIAADFGYEVEQGITEEIGVQLLQEAEKAGRRQHAFAGGHGHGPCRSRQDLDP